jgi:hypothetical protein
MGKPFSVNFDDIKDFVGNHFFNDPKSREIITNAGLSESQIKIINTLILTALKAYDLQKQ